MNARTTFIALALVLAISPCLTMAQQPTATTEDTNSKIEKDEKQTSDQGKVENLSEPSEEFKAKRLEVSEEEEAAILPYYNNFMKDYRLGPEDVISITVFGQERYSRVGITVPPHGKIAYPLIPEGILVAGKTTTQLQQELTKRLDEYIIDPKITVSLDQAKSSRYSVLGDVAQPGVKPMTRRLTVYEALSEAGGFLPTANKKKVALLRRKADGKLHPTLVNISDIEKGKTPDITYLAPGDQIIVPGSKFKKALKEISEYSSLFSFASIFLWR
jgi:polysaccharide biosynthesis/export protein